MGCCTRTRYDDTTQKSNLWFSLQIYFLIPPQFNSRFENKTQSNTPPSLSISIYIYIYVCTQTLIHAYILDTWNNPPWQLGTRFIWRSCTLCLVGLLLFLGPSASTLKFSWIFEEKGRIFLLINSYLIFVYLFLLMGFCFLAVLWAWILILWCLIWLSILPILYTMLLCSLVLLFRSSIVASMAVMRFISFETILFLCLLEGV